MRDVQQKTIGDSIYHVMPLGAGKARALSMKVMRLAGSGLDRVTALDEEGILGMVGAILGNVNEADVEAMVAILVDSTMLEAVAGSGMQVPLKGAMDVHMAGAFDEQVQWIVFALTVHLGPLVDWLKSLTPPASAKAAASASPSRRASGGPSTG